jgi:hypothetical protein
MSVNVTMTETAYFSPSDLSSDYIVTNDFSIVLDKDDTGDGGLDFPTVLISGLDVLYVDPASQTKDYSDFISNFLQLFSSDIDGWETAVDSSVSPPRLKLLYSKRETADAAPSYPVRYTLSTKAAFPRVLDKKCSYDIIVYPDEKKPDLYYTRPLSLLFAPYVCQFGAYVTEGGVQKQVDTLYHGEKCNISWTVKGDQKADVFVRIGDYFTNSQNSCELTVLKDTYCSFLLQSESVNMESGFTVYRTLMKDTGEKSLLLPEPDRRCVNSKIFLGSDYKYYCFFYPSLYMSEDLKSWSVTATDTNADFSSYTVSFYNDRLAVCYMSSANIISSILDLNNLSEGFKHNEISDSSGYKAAFLVLSDNKKLKITVYGEDGAEISDLKNDTEMINTEFIAWDENFSPKSADIHTAENELCMTVLGENGRIYYYNLYDETKNDVFTDFMTKPNRVTLVTAGKHYIVTDTAVICLENSNNTDLHSSLGINFLPAENNIYNFFTLRYVVNGYGIWQYGF